MKKYFLFRKEQTNVDSAVIDNSGDRVSIFAVPSDSLAFISSELGKVVFVFNQATVYEESNLTDGESMKKTVVSVECEIEKEFQLIEEVLGFMSRDSQPGRNIMRFDALGESTFPSGSPTVASPKRPVKRGTQNQSAQSFIGSSDAFTVSSATVIAGVDFEDADNMPLVDYNETATDFDGFSDGAEITAWKNDTKATGGTTYDITSNVGTPKIAFADDRIGTKYVDSLASGSAVDYFVVPEINISGPYTLYFVHYANEIALPTVPPRIYSDEEGDCFGFTKKGDRRTVSLRHDGVSGSPAETEFIEKYLDTDYIFSEVTDGNLSSVDSIRPFVIRRDAAFNISIYNYEGKLAAFIPGVVPESLYKSLGSSLISGESVGSQGRTDGNLKITRLGDGADGSNTTSKAFWSRFGVINKDVGADLAASIATQLYERYQP